MASNSTIIFFTNQTQNISSIPYSFSSATGSFKVWGTWDGANLTLFTGVVGDPSTFIPVTITGNGTPLFLTADGGVGIENIVNNEEIVAVLSDVGGSTSLNCTMQATQNG